MWHTCLIRLKLGKDTFLNYGQRYKGVEDPDLVFTHVSVDTQIEDECDPNPEPDSISQLVNDGKAKEECKRVPEGMCIPANQTFSEKGHQESRRLDCNQNIVAKIHTTLVWYQVASESSKLIRCI